MLVSDPESLPASSTGRPGRSSAADGVLPAGGAHHARRRGRAGLLRRHAHRFRRRPRLRPPRRGTRRARRHRVTFVRAASLAGRECSWTGGPIGRDAARGRWTAGSASSGSWTTSTRLDSTSILLPSEHPRHVELGQRPALETMIRGAGEERQWNPVRCRCSHDPGQAAQALEQCALEAEPCSRLVGALGERHGKGQRIDGVESGVDGHQLLEGPRRQPGADQQHEGERNLRRDQPASRTQPLASVGGAAARPRSGRQMPRPPSCARREAVRAATPQEPTRPRRSPTPSCQPRSPAGVAVPEGPSAPAAVRPAARLEPRRGRLPDRAPCSRGRPIPPDARAVRRARTGSRTRCNAHRT